MASCRAWNCCRAVLHRLRATAETLRGVGARLAGEDCGQGTVEFCLVAAAFVVVAVGLWSIVQAFLGGAVSEHAVASVAHALSAAPASVLADIFAV